MKRIILILAIVTMTINLFSQTANDSTRYTYDIMFQCKAQPTKSITNKHYKLFIYAMQDRFNKNVKQRDNRVGIIRNLYAERLDSTIAEIMDLSFDGVNFFEDMYVEMVIQNNTLDEKYRAWYKSGAYQTHIYVESYEPYNAGDWYLINQ